MNKNKKLEKYNIYYIIYKKIYISKKTFQKLNRKEYKNRYYQKIPQYPQSKYFLFLY